MVTRWMQPNLFTTSGLKGTRERESERKFWKKRLTPWVWFWKPKWKSQNNLPLCYKQVIRFRVKQFIQYQKCYQIRDLSITFKGKFSFQERVYVLDFVLGVPSSNPAWGHFVSEWEKKIVTQELDGELLTEGFIDPVINTYSWMVTINGIQT